jgi:hypothetical protein
MLEKFDCHDTGPVFPSFIVVPLPCEHNFLPGNQFAVFAERGPVFALLSDHIPTIFTTDAHLRSDIPGTHVVRSEPLF